MMRRLSLMFVNSQIDATFKNLKINNMNYKGQLQGFPKEVVDKMLEHQERQGNEKDITVFEQNIEATKPTGGFTWEDTHEGRIFWSDVISCNRFDTFFAMYPKKDAQQDNVVALPSYYNNDNGSLYKVATERGWNAYLFDIVKRLERGGKKDPLEQEIDKTIGVLNLWKQESKNNLAD